MASIRSRSGLAFVEPPVPAADPTVSRGRRFAVAVALPTPDVVDGRPTGAAYTEVRGVSRPEGVDRILVGGVDITKVNGKTTATPPYRLMEPFAYGASTLTIPGVNPLFMKYGKGTAYKWARDGAKVVYQRVDPDTGAVLATDYRGEITALKSSAGRLVAEVGGQITGPAEFVEWPPSIFRRVRDIERYVDSFLGALHVPFKATDNGCGIPLVRPGGMSGIAYLQQLCAMAQRRNGDQYTLMPVTWGRPTFEFRKKNRTRIDYTIYIDGTRVSEDLTDEAPVNSWYGTCITPDGYLERGSRVPGGVQGTPPPYPKAGGGSFGIGTTDADTVNGDGITVLSQALAIFGYLDWEERSSVYDQNIAEAVEDLQEASGRTETGTMNQATWDDLFDLSVTGPTTDGARIFPILEDKRLRKNLWTATGHFAGRNPLYDPSINRRDRKVDFGPGWTYKSMKRWFRAQNARTADTGNYVGTVRLEKIGVIKGRHDFGDPPPTAADVVSFRDIRPGTNAWFPQLGKVLHIPTVEVDPANGATLDVDYQARDALEVKEIIRRNHESRNDPRRQRRNEKRRSQLQHDAHTPWERWCGVLPWDVECVADGWTVFWVFAGDGGRIARLMLDTKNAPAESTVLVFSRKVTKAQLEQHIPNPRAVNENGESVFETNAQVQRWMKNRDLKLVVGSKDNPGGYGWRRKTGDNGKPTGAPLTGLVVDDDGFDYITGAEPALYIAVHPDRATTVDAGRILYREAEDLA